MKRYIFLAALALFASAAFAGPGPTPSPVKKVVHQKEIEMDPARTIVIREGIDIPTDERVVADITAMDRESQAPIYLILRSPGGAVDSGFSIINAIASAKSPVICVVDTEAYSMAAIILAFCDTAVMHKFANIMHHEPAFGLRGQMSQVVSRMKFVTEYLTTMERFTFKAINKRRVSHGVAALTWEEYLARLQKEWWMTAEQAKAEGMIDIVVSKLQYEWEPPLNSGGLFSIGGGTKVQYFDATIVTPKFKVGQKVKVTEGSYKGCTNGIVVDMFVGRSFYYCMLEDLVCGGKVKDQLVVIPDTFLQLE